MMEGEKKIQTTKSAGAGKAIKRFFFRFFILLLLSSAFAVYWFFFNIYSEGERKGTLIKITRKGNVFKTHEGEMWLSCRQVMNTSSEKFFFSVTSDSLANVLMSLQDECVQLQYKQYRKVLPWRGDSPYIVTGVEGIASEKIPQLQQLPQLIQ